MRAIAWAPLPYEQTGWGCAVAGCDALAVGLRVEPDGAHEGRCARHAPKVRP